MYVKNLPFNYTQIKQNFSTMQNKTNKYIVVHDSGNTRATANAEAHYRYFNNNTLKSSAHYFVDDVEVRQIIGDHQVAWHCGDGKGAYGIWNSNSIGIELCINSDGNYNVAFANTVELVKNLMERYNIPASNVVRHYDASRKRCPGSMAANNWAKWKEFHKLIQEPKYLDMDLSKTSISKEVKKKEPAVPSKPTIQKINLAEGKKSKAYSINNLTIIETTIDNLYIQQLGGKTLRQTGVYGINGVFWDGDSKKQSATCSIAVNGGKIIGDNAYTNYYQDSKVGRATLIYGAGRLTVERINNINQFNRKVDFAVGGIGLYPSFDPDLEKVPDNIRRSTFRTGVAFKGKTVFLIVGESMTLQGFRQRILNSLNIDGAISVDGGGSTQMYYLKDIGIKSTRGINNVIGLKVT